MEAMKCCTKCKQTKPIVDFYRDKRKCSGLKSACKACENERVAAYRASTDWEAKRRKAVKNYARSDKRKRTEEEYLRRRTERLALATPRWVSQAALARIYAEADRLTVETGVKHEVHHVHPLLEYEPLFCGLHVPWNLEIVTVEEHVEAHAELRSRFGKQVQAAKKIAQK